MTTELAKTNSEPGKIKDLIQSDRFKHAIAAALPAHLKPERFVRVALTALTRVPKLAQCDQASFFQCLLTLSQFGLEPDGRNAHLIPFENRKRGVTECQVILDYKGLVDLAMRSGRVAYVHADKVCANDVFEYDRGEIKTHKIDFKQPRGDAYAYYAICRFKDNTEKCEVMTKDEVEKIRQRSRAKDSGPWVTDFDEMAKKTVFRRLSKWIQLSPEFREALDLDADALEDRRFEAALPVIPIERPRISEAASSATDKKPTKKELKEAKANADEIEKRVKEAGYSVVDVWRVGIAKAWFDAPENWDQTDEGLKDVPLASVGATRLATLLENWGAVAGEIEALRPAPEPKEKKEELPFE